MSPHRRAPFVALLTLLRQRFPYLNDPALQIAQGLVLVNGAISTNSRARVRSDAAIRILHRHPLRGTIKLAHALSTFGARTTDTVALDLGAAAGGSTQALLQAGAARVYAVDAGAGQLRGWLRADPKVINLERTNLAQLDQQLIPEPVDLIVMDLSYLAIASAIGQIDGKLLTPNAELIALIKPTFELRTAGLADQPEQVSAAVEAAVQALTQHGWEVLGHERSPILGSKGAVEMLVHARRTEAGHGSDV